jgi:hypothetical protein
MSIEQPGYMARYEHHILSGGDLAETGMSLLDVARDAGADFDVSYADASYINPNSGAMVTPLVEKGRYRGNSQNVFVVRKDNGATVGLHGHKYPRTDGYKPVLRTAETLFPLSASSLTLFGKGEKVVFGQNIGKTVDLGGGDILRPMLYWTSSLNGQWATAVYSVMDRLFCQNQLIGATPIISVKHTINHDQMLDMRAEILHEQIQRAEVFAEMALVLKDQEYTDFQFRSLTHQLVPDPEEAEAGGDDPRLARRGWGVGPEPLGSVQRCAGRRTAPHPRSWNGRPTEPGPLVGAHHKWWGAPCQSGDGVASRSLI